MQEPDSLDYEAYHSRWEGMWSKGLKPGEAFDAHASSPALTVLLERGRGLDVVGRRVFVPGCGRGYDLATFVRAGAALAVGLELAPSALRDAAGYLDAELSGEARGKAELHAGDFFQWQHPDGQAFLFGYDYTFFW